MPKTTISKSSKPKTTKPTKKQSSDFFSKFLQIVEKYGNKLPHPVTLFAIFAILVLIISWLAYISNIKAIHPGTGQTISPVNLLSITGLHKILTNMVKNFTNFAPLGTVLVTLLGIGIAEHTGLISASLKLLVTKAPKKLLTFIIVVAGILSNIGSDVGYVLLVPLGAIIFLAAGRHPLAGLAAAFAGVSGGYSANLFIGTIDPLLADLTEEAAKIVNPAYKVSPLANYYFMFISTFLIALLGTWVTEKIIIPKLGNFDSNEYKDIEIDTSMTKLSSKEKKGLLYATMTGFVLLLLILIGILPEHGFLRGVDGSILHSPFLKGIVAIIFILSLVIGISYGIGAGTIKNDHDVVDGMSKSMKSIATYIVLVFFAAQFVAYFKWSNLGLIIAIKSADWLKALGLGTIPLMLLFIIVSSFINLFMGSASAKWAIMAPVFVPMFMFLGYSPEFVQAAYRIGDSSTNIISPMMSYFALIIAFVSKYDKKAGIGTVVSLMLPYSIVFLLGWSLLFIVWYLLDLPIGPGVGVFLQ